MVNKASYEELTRKLQDLQEVVEALRSEDVDAIIGTHNVLLLRLKETEEQLRKHRDYLEVLVVQRTEDLKKANQNLQEELARRQKIEAQREIEHQDRLRAYERLAAVGRLSGNIAHELRNPLATIDSSAYYLEITLAGTSGKTTAHIGRIREATKHCQTVIRALLEHARLREPVLEMFDLKELVTSLVIELDPPPRVRLSLDFPPDEMPVKADREQIRMALVNVLRNAIEAIPEAGTVSLGACYRGQAVCLTCADSGVGIPGENLKKIFDPLFSTKSGGVGFGLAMARMIIGKHGGDAGGGLSAGQGRDVHHNTARGPGKRGGPARAVRRLSGDVAADC